MFKSTFLPIHFSIPETEQMRPGIVLDGEPPIASPPTGNVYMEKNESMDDKDAKENNKNTKPSINCFAQILLGIKCEINGIDDNNAETTENASNISTNSMSDGNDKDQNDKNTQSQGEISETDDNEKIVTVKDGLIPDRDEVFIKKPLFSSQVVPVPLENDTKKSTSNNEKLGIETLRQIEVTLI